MNATNITITNATRVLVGGFQRSVLLCSVDKRGNMKLAQTSRSCTFVGDRKSIPIVLDATAPMVAVVQFHGNGARESFVLTPKAATRLERAGVSVEEALNAMLAERARAAHIRVWGAAGDAP